MLETSIWTRLTPAPLAWVWFQRAGLDDPELRPDSADVSMTTPVRWWRDDAERYRSRPPYVAPPVEDGAGRWALELLTGARPSARAGPCCRWRHRRCGDVRGEISEGLTRCAAELAIALAAMIENHTTGELAAHALGELGFGAAYLRRGCTDADCPAHGQ